MKEFELLEAQNKLERMTAVWPLGSGRLGWRILSAFGCMCLDVVHLHIPASRELPNSTILRNESVFHVSARAPLHR